MHNSLPKLVAQLSQSGGLYNNGTLTLTNSVISGNSATFGGGVLNAATNAMNYSNTIIANSTGGDCINFGSGTNMNNLVEDGSCSAGLSGDPNLGPLSSNGGPTQTMPLLTGSPAIDQGNAAICGNPPVSGIYQRGVSRPQGAGCDIGAYEGGVAATFPAVVSHSLAPSYPGAGPNIFAVTFSENVDDPAGDTATDDVTNPANYLVAEAGPNAVFDTAACIGGLAGDDTQAAITSVTYDAAAFTSTVNLVSALPVGKYRLFVCGTTSIVNLALRPLNNGGSDFTFDFAVTTAAATVTSTPASSVAPRSTPVAPSIPVTGFAPNIRSALGPQQIEQAYTMLDSIWIEIPALQLRTDVVGVPRSGNGWDVQWLGSSAGWLNGTAFPTWEGNSVITAHVYSADGLPGPFVNLSKLMYGDSVIVHLAGQEYTFEVTDSRLVSSNSTGYALEHLENHSYLTLITCQAYDAGSNTYLLRRVVRAVLVEVESERNDGPQR